MVDIVVTAANVVPGADAVTEPGILGFTGTQGQTVYLDPADGKIKAADANLSLLASQTRGILLTSGVNGQPCIVQRGGKINPGGAVVNGTVYVQSANPGGIAPAADLAAGHNVTVLGVGISATQIQMPLQGPFVSGGLV